MLNEELMKKAKEAKSAEELLTLAKDNDYPLDEEGAKEIFCQLHTEGELGDDELDSVSGGGCACYTKVGGQKYVIVTPQLECFNGQFKRAFKIKTDINGAGRVTEEVDFIVKDNLGLRGIWISANLKDHVCGNCMNLGFKVGTGYCKLS